MRLYDETKPLYIETDVSGGWTGSCHAANKKQYQLP